MSVVNGISWPLSTFPSTNSIPTPQFYTMQGLATYLNQNPGYKKFFVGYNRYFPYLYTDEYIEELVADGALPPFEYNYTNKNVPLQPYVIKLSDQQSRIYKQQFEIFRKVYTFNSNAYSNYRTVLSTTNGQSNINPVYYRFQNYNEYTNYRAGVGLVNKLYPFNIMANGSTLVDGSTLNWIVPFPL